MKKLSTLSIVSLFLHSSCSTVPNGYFRDPANAGQKSAFQVWGELMESSVTYDARTTPVKGGNRKTVTWGAEKEGSSSMITRVMGPDADEFDEYIENMTDQSKKTFYKNFFQKYKSNTVGDSYRVYRDENGVKIDPAEELLDGRGRNKKIDISFLDGFEPENASLDELQSKWDTWLSKTNDNPFSYMKPALRRHFYNGNNIPGYNGGQVDEFSSFKPIIGKAENFISGTSYTSVGWEINFEPLNTYGEFQEMIAWFKKIMGTNGQLFQAPGHQRMVFPKTASFDPKKFAEISKAAQALIVLEGINGRVGIETANYKDVIPDASLVSNATSGSGTGRGPIRYDHANAFGSNTRSIEFRAGTKDKRVARFVQTSAAARLARGDFKGLKDADAWTLVPGTSSWGSDIDFSEERLVRDFGVTAAQARKAASKLDTADLGNYNVVFWNWYDEDNPMIGETKRAILKSQTKDYIQNVAKIRATSHNKVQEAVRSLQRDWVNSTKLTEEVQNYLMPVRKARLTNDTHKFKPRSRSGVNVNKVDLGNEYSAKFPVRLQADYSMYQDEAGNYKQLKLADQKPSWLQTRVDMNPEEKEAYIKKMAIDLRNNLGGTGEALRISEESHGHGLGIAYEIRDSQNRKWRVEWDGIGRSYTPTGQVIESSLRGGSIEVVTPKFEPNIKEIETIFKTFEQNNALPYQKAGGGHVNLDLAAFAGKPKQFARFLAAFHEHRSIIAFMFQDLHRAKSAEAVDISDEFAKKLANWTGTENELKKSLYNEGYFNKRVGRKTRYTHLDVSAYFQDVIPPEYISDDFDISDPSQKWRPAFRVEPNIRKGEFRLFNAPRDAYESAMQMKLVRALMYKAFNTRGQIAGNLQQTSHEDYVNNPGKVFEDLKKMTTDLDLNINEYRPFAGESLANAELYVKSVFYKPLSERLSIHKKYNGWGSAVRPRSMARGISSEGREFAGSYPAEANEFQRLRKRAARDNVSYISDGVVNYLGTPRLVRQNSCEGMIQQLADAADGQ